MDYYIRDGKIDIPYNIVKNIDASKTITDFIVENVKNNNISYPYEEYILNPYKMSYFKPSISIVDNTILFSDDSKDAYLLDKITDYFTQQVRVNTGIYYIVTLMDELRQNIGVKVHKTPIDIWKDNIQTIVNEAIKVSIKYKHDFNTKLLAYTINDVFKIKQHKLFSVSLVIFICDRYCSKDGIFLDPFSEWGDRAIGAALSDKVSRYIGIDMNDNLISGYIRIKEFLKYIRPDKSIEFYISKIEDMVFNDLEVDLIFTSPPHYLERTSEYDWVTSWFIPITTKLFGVLKRGGYFIYFIYDVIIDTIYSELVNVLGKPRNVYAYERNGVISSGKFYIWWKPRWVNHQVLHEGNRYHEEKLKIKKIHEYNISRINDIGYVDTITLL